MATQRPTVNRQSRIRPRIIAIVVVIVAAVASVASAADEPKPLIKFHDTVKEAFRVARADKKVTAVFFKAAWCGWCRKMTTETMRDPKVVAAAAKFVWVKVDIDQQREVAAVFDVRGVPVVALVNVRGDVIDSQAGYLTAEQMLAFLNKSADRAEAAGGDERIGQAIDAMNKALAAATSAKAARDAVAPVVELMAQPTRAGREALLDAVGKLAPVGWDGLIELMADQRLAVRAAAGLALALATRADLPFDAFDEPEARGKQVDAWRQWITENRNRPRPQPQPPAAAPKDADTSPPPKPDK